jgi:class 3 adenylate cyclase
MAIRAAYAHWKRRLETLSWDVVRTVADAIRYQPSRLDLSLAYGASHPAVPGTIARWVASEHARPATERGGGVPYTLIRRAAEGAERIFGPAGSAVVRSLSAALFAGLDRAGAHALKMPLKGARPNVLVPHLHHVAIVAVDMRGFSNLTGVLDDTQYLAELIGEYLSTLTRVVESHGGVVYQYTGDGLLAVFLPEIAGTDGGRMLERLVSETTRDLHAAFDELFARWQAEWRASGRTGAPVGLGIGLSYGRATIGLLGPSGKKQFGVVGEPINTAAFLCSQALAGNVLVDRDSFTRARATVPDGRHIRLRSKKRHQRLDVISLRYGRSRR